MKTYAAIVIAALVLFIGVNAAFAAGEGYVPVPLQPEPAPPAAEPVPAPEPAPAPAPEPAPAPAPTPAPEPAPAPAPDVAPVPLPSVTDLVNILKSGSEEDAKKAADALVAKGEEAIQPLLDLQAAGDATAAPRATEALKRIGCVDGVYAVARLFHKDFEPFDTVGIQFYFRNFTKNPVSIMNPVSPADPENTFDLGWKMTLKNADGKTVGTVDMGEGTSAAQVIPTDFITIPPGESYNDVVFAQKSFGLERLDMGAYTLEAEYGCKPDFAADVKKRADLKLENFTDKTIVSPALTFKVGLTGVVEVTPEQEAKIKKYITDLGNDDYQTREDAAKALEEVGPPALPYLRDAAQRTTDPQVRYAADQLANRLVKPAEEKVTYIGVQMDPMVENIVKIVGIIPDSPAAHAGLADGDIVVKVDGFLLQGTTAQRFGYLRKYIMSHREGETIELTIQRPEGEKTLTIQLARIAKQVFPQQP
jgi:hypothetical protein